VVADQPKTDPFPLQLVEFALQIIAQQPLEIADLFFRPAPILR
jgi:hypothetical protein